jgi:hypothetical protein
MEPHGDIGAMGAALDLPAGLIHNPRCVERAGERVLLTPATQIMGFDLETAECTDGGRTEIPGGTR